MTDQRKPGVIGSLPRTRPHRRSDKRVAPPSGAPPLTNDREQAPAPARPAAKPRTTKAAAKPKKPAAARKPAAATKPAAAGKPPTTAKKPSAAGKPSAATSAPKPARTRAARARPAPQARNTAPRPATPPPPREPSPGALETAVQAAAELAEIGLHAGARALRRALSRLPRP
jgi:hypothetical protein